MVVLVVATLRRDLTWALGANVLTGQREHARCLIASAAGTHVLPAAETRCLSASGMLHSGAALLLPFPP